MYPIVDLYLSSPSDYRRISNNPQDRRPKQVHLKVKKIPLAMCKIYSLTFNGYRMYVCIVIQASTATLTGCSHKRLATSAAVGNLSSS